MHLNIRAALMGLTFVIMWSSAFSSARIIVQSAPPLSALCLRFLVSGLIAVVLARLLGQSIRLSRAQWTSTIVFGLCQNALYLGLFFVAMQWIGAGIAAIIASSMPLMVAFLGRVFLKEKIRPLGVLGLLAGLAGVVLIMTGRLAGGSLDLFGIGICAIGVLGLAVATMLVRGASSGGNVLMIVGLQMLVGSVALLVPALGLETFDVKWSAELIVAFAYTTIVPGLGATWIWFQLVRMIGSTRAAAYHFLNPFFGVAIAALLLGESMTLRDVIGVAVVTAGILAVQLSAIRSREIISAT